MSWSIFGVPGDLERSGVPPTVQIMGKEFPMASTIVTRVSQCSRSRNIQLDGSVVTYTPWRARAEHTGGRVLVVTQSSSLDTNVRLEHLPRCEGGDSVPYVDCNRPSFPHKAQVHKAHLALRGITNRLEELSSRKYRMPSLPCHTINCDRMPVFANPPSLGRAICNKQPGTKTRIVRLRHELAPL